MPTVPHWHAKGGKIKLRLFRLQRVMSLFLIAAPSVAKSCVAHLLRLLRPLRLGINIISLCVVTTITTTHITKQQLRKTRKKTPNKHNATKAHNQNRMTLQGHTSRSSALNNIPKNVCLLTWNAFNGIIAYLQCAKPEGGKSSAIDQNQRSTHFSR